MAWLRIDDGYDSHPKILALGSDQRRWTWTRILVYTCRYRSPIIPTNITDSVPRATPQFLRECVGLGLVDVTDEGQQVVHDWDSYNGKDQGAAERMARVRAKMPRVSGGQWEKARSAVFDRDQGICADCGKDCKTPVDGRDIWNADHEPPRDELVELGISIYDIAYIVTRCHSCHSKKTRAQANHDRTTTEPNPNGSVPSRVGARARPVPNPSPKTSPAAVRPPEDPAAAADLERLRTAGWSNGQLDKPDLDRAIAWLDHYQADPTAKKPAALAWTKYSSSPAWPDTPRTELAPGAVGTRSSSPPLPHREPISEPEAVPPPTEFRALAANAAAPPPRLSRPRVPKPEGDS